MKNTKKFGAAAALALAAAAFAQPATFTDLGTHTSAETFSQAVEMTGPADVQWYRIVLPANSTVDGYVDIWTTSGGSAPMTDTEAGIYDDAGNLIADDDDSDAGLFTLLSFGQNTPARPANGTGNPRTGQDGQLAGGTYWIAVGRFNVNFGAGWGVTSTYAGTDRSTTLNFTVQPPGSPIPPSGSIALSPDHGNVGDVFTAAVTVVPGANPVSTGITVVLDASAVNASSSISLHDDGVAPDDFAGDNIFSGNVTVGAGTAQGAHALVATIHDAQNRTGTTGTNFIIPQANDYCDGAVAAVVGSNFFDNTTATLDGGTPCGFNNGKDIWYTFDAPVAGDYTIDTCGTASFDSVLTAYDTCNGTVLACNDDNCALQSRITVNGLTPGVPIIIRLASYNNNAGGSGTFQIAALGPTDPTGIGAATPNPSFPGDVVQMRVTVTPGVRPISSGLAVTGDTSMLGGGTAETFYDDGSNGDDFAGDNVFSRLVTIPSDYTGAAYSIPFHISDAEGRSGDGTLQGQVSVPAQWDETRDGLGDAGDMLATAQVPAGSGQLSSIGGVIDGSDVDMYKIQICDAGGFSATTVSTDTTGDTQMWLFSADGHGVQFNDDSAGAGSTFGNEFVTATGTYYIAISQYNIDAVDDAGQLIWNNTPFAGVRAPDGPGAASVLAGWTGTTFGLNYKLSMTGVCFAGCAADFNGDQVVDFFDYLDFVQAFAANDPSADFNGDDVIDFFDYLDFVQAFSTGC